MISFYPKVKEVSVLHRNDPVLKVDDPIFFQMLLMMTMIGMLSSSSSSNTIVKSLLAVATTALEVSSSVNSHLGKGLLTIISKFSNFCRNQQKFV